MQNFTDWACGTADGMEVDFARVTSQVLKAGRSSKQKMDMDAAQRGKVQCDRAPCIKMCNGSGQKNNHIQSCAGGGTVATGIKIRDQAHVDSTKWEFTEGLPDSFEVDMVANLPAEVMNQMYAAGSGHPFLAMVAMSIYTSLAGEAQPPIKDADREDLLSGAQTIIPLLRDTCRKARVFLHLIGNQAEPIDDKSCIMKVRINIYNPVMVAVAKRNGWKWNAEVTAAGIGAVVLGTSGGWAKKHTSTGLVTVTKPLPRDFPAQITLSQKEGHTHKYIKRVNTGQWCFSKGGHEACFQTKDQCRASHIPELHSVKVAKAGAAALRKETKAT